MNRSTILLTLSLLCTSLLFCSGAYAQVTTSSLTGLVQDAEGQPLIGATVKATHLPSGTVYGSTTQSNGNFTIQGMRIGGPYRVEISYIGYEPKIIDDIQLSLGQPYTLTEKLAVGGTALQEVTVTATGSRLSHERTGASTIISSRQLGTLPSITRDITDFTRLTPQAGSNNAFAGRDGRYNNLQVDGVNLNNNFGLSNDLMPGGGASPVSLDAYDEISVNIAPYDVRQSGFTGAGINAVTKSGTNTFHGTLYGFYRDQDFNGKKVNGETLTLTPQKHQTLGGSLGGPIIKNKLFFFVNAEFEKASQPGITYTPAGSTYSGNPSSTPVDSLEVLSEYLKSKYSYDPGAYENFPNFDTKNHKILAKIDWNINQVHKLTLKYTDFKSSDMSPLNGSSVPNGGGFTVTSPTASNPGATSTLSRLPNNRFSSKSMGFSNSNYGTDHIVQTASLELNSNFSSKIANQLLVTYSHINDHRTIPGGKVFPTIDIFNGAGQNQLSAGTDPFTNNNDVINNVLDITENFTYYAGIHTLTAGATYEHQKVGNMFMPGSESYYIYNSLDDFLQNRYPVYYAYTYSIVPGTKDVYSADMKLGQLGIYLQDEYAATDKLKLTVGLRADLPIYGEKPIENPAITELEFRDEDGNPVHYNTGIWPKDRVLFSPRVGFRWDAIGDQSLIVRGGTGIFTGKIPFVWLTNMPSNSGMYQIGVSVKDPEAEGLKFDPNPDGHADKFPTSVANPTVPANFVAIDPDFRFPQVWRTNVGVDKSLGAGFTASLDLMYTKDIHAVKMRNLNLKAPDLKLNGPDDRPHYSTVPTADGMRPDNKIYDNLGTPIVLENTNKGHSLAATLQIAKAFSHGLYGSLAYTYTRAREVSSNPGSQATSAWNNVATVGTTNDIELQPSEYAVPHRIVADLSYRIEYADHGASTISVYYQGMAQGTYSFVYNGDLNGDGNGADLMYIYPSGKDVPFAPYSVKDANGNVIRSYTVEQQQQAYDQFINSSKYLKKHKGEYASRYGALIPWFNELDIRFLQDFFITTTGGTRHTLQFSVDLVNLPNLISSKWKNWGYRQMYSLNNPLKYVAGSADAAGEPQYTLSEYNDALITNAYTPNVSTSSTWGLQLGLRYSF